MWLISDLCRSDRVYPECDINRLTAQMFKQHGDDLLPYLEPLNQAMQAGIEGEVIDWVNRMAEVNKYQLSMDNSSVFVEALEQYADHHPLPTEYLYEQLNVGLLTHLDEFSAEELEYLHDRADEHMLLVMKINFSLQMPIPAFRGLLDACKTYPELSQSCLSIGRLMVLDDGQYFSLAIGHKIQSSALHLAGKPDAAEQAEQKRLAYKAEITCLNNLFTYPVIGKMDLDFMRENMQIKREQGERPALIHSARFYYQQDLVEGADPDELKQPASCLVGAQ